MKIVRDLEGREWTLDLQWSHIETMMAKGIDLMGGSALAAHALLLEITKLQRAQRRVVDKAFGKTLGSAAYAEAVNAVVEEVADFFPKADGPPEETRQPEPSPT